MKKILEVYQLLLKIINFYQSINFQKFQICIQNGHIIIWQSISLFQKLKINNDYKKSRASKLLKQSKEFRNFLQSEKTKTQSLPKTNSLAQFNINYQKYRKPDYKLEPLSRESKYKNKNQSVNILQNHAPNPYLNQINKQVFSSQQFPAVPLQFSQPHQQSYQQQHKLQQQLFQSPLFKQLISLATKENEKYFPVEKPSPNYNYLSQRKQHSVEQKNQQTLSQSKVNLMKRTPLKEEDTYPSVYGKKHNPKKKFVFVDKESEEEEIDFKSQEKDQSYEEEEEYEEKEVQKYQPRIVQLIKQKSDQITDLNSLSQEQLFKYYVSKMDVNAPCKLPTKIIYEGSGMNQKMQTELLKIIDIALDTIKQNLKDCAQLLRKQFNEHFPTNWVVILTEINQDDPNFFQQNVCSASFTSIENLNLRVIFGKKIYVNILKSGQLEDMNIDSLLLKDTTIKYVGKEFSKVLIPVVVNRVKALIQKENNLIGMNQAFQDLIKVMMSPEWVGEITEEIESEGEAQKVDAQKLELLKFTYNSGDNVYLITLEKGDAVIEQRISSIQFQQIIAKKYPKFEFQESRNNVLSNSQIAQIIEQSQQSINKQQDFIQAVKQIKMTLDNIFGPFWIVLAISQHLSRGVAYQAKDKKKVILLYNKSVMFYIFKYA